MDINGMMEQCMGMMGSMMDGGMMGIGGMVFMVLGLLFFFLVLGLALLGGLGYLAVRRLRARA
jgi:hypothetical protein